MKHGLLVAAIACLACAPGCSTLGSASFPPPGTAAARTRGAAADAEAEVDAIAGGGSWLGRSDWWPRTRRRLEQVAADIRADLDFHETEGLEAFSPDAVEHVKLMRAEMNDDGGLGR